MWTSIYQFIHPVIRIAGLNLINMIVLSLKVYLNYTLLLNETCSLNKEVKKIIIPFRD